jgi:hypothetical protein
VRPRRTRPWRRVRLFCRFAPLVALVALSYPASAWEASTTPDEPAPGFYTAESLVAMGYGNLVPDLVKETGLPPCPLIQPFDPGIPPGEKDRAGVQDDPECAMQMHGAQIGIGLTAPHAAYHWNGHESINQAGMGVSFNIEVGNPGVDRYPNCYPSPEEFVAARVLSKAPPFSPPYGNWTEAGWTKHSCLGATTGPCPYGYDVPEKQWHVFCYELPIQPGNRYKFRVYHVNGAGQNGVWGQINYNGAWQTVESNGNMKCKLSNGAANCKHEVYYELYSEDSTPHPDLYADYDGAVGNGFNTGEFKVLASGAWTSWDQGTIAAIMSEYSPYEYCSWTKWTGFIIKKSVTCANP